MGGYHTSRSSKTSATKIMSAAEGRINMWKNSGSASTSAEVNTAVHAAMVQTDSKTEIEKTLKLSMGKPVYIYVARITVDSKDGAHHSYHSDVLIQSPTKIRNTRWKV